jgi:hypothetical protein
MATNTAGSLAYAFNVTTGGKLIFTPEPQNIVNEFDYMGLLLSLPRLPGERNADYRGRLWDVYVHRAGSHEAGLMNGITRELGLLQYDALTITTSTAAEPRVIVGSTRVYLYDDWKSSTDYHLDTSIDIFSRDGSGYYLSGLVTAINASDHFTASLASGVDGHTRSAVLIFTDSNTVIEDDLFPIKRNLLTYQDVVEGSVGFSFGGRNVFVEEKTSEATVLADGDYFIDYDEGLVVSYSTPTEATVARYIYRGLPITLKASPVILYEFGSDAFRDEVFEQVLQPDGTYEDGLPNGEAMDYINELLNAKGMLWGE